MPVQIIGTDADETFNVQMNQTAGSTFDGGGGADVLVLTTPSTGTTLFDFTTAERLINFETIRGSANMDHIRLTAAQVASISRFEVGGTYGPDYLVISGQQIDFRNKTLVGSYTIRMLDQGAHITVSSRDMALNVAGTGGAAQHLTIEGPPPVANDLKVLHSRGIDFIHYVEDNQQKTSSNLAPVVTGLSGDAQIMPVGQAVHLDVGADAQVTDEQPLRFMSVSLLGVSVSGNPIDLDTSAGVISLTQLPDNTKAVFVNNVEIGRLTNLGWGSLSFSFNDNATGPRVQELLRALTYKHGIADDRDDGTVRITITDDGGRSTKADLPIRFPNSPPSFYFYGDSAREGAGEGSYIGFFDASDPDRGDEVTFVLLDDAGGRFRLRNGDLEVLNGSLLDYETSRSHTITVRATDSRGLSTDKTFVITVEDDSSDNPIRQSIGAASRSATSALPETTCSPGPPGTTGCAARVGPICSTARPATTRSMAVSGTIFWSAAPARTSSCSTQRRPRRRTAIGSGTTASPMT
jgi:hypothetical protein